MTLVFLPILIPFCTAVLCLFAYQSVRLQRVLAVAGAAGLLASGLALVAEVSAHGAITLHVGGWQPPFAIVLAADLLSALMIAITGVVALTGAVYSLADIPPARQQVGYFSLMHILFMGVCGAFLTGDLFNLYVWFEVMLMASFALLVLGGERSHVRGALTYVSLNLVSSTIFLAAAGLIYAVCHTLEMADLGGRLEAIGSTHPHLVAVMGMLLAVSFGIKAGVFPLFSWLPASYHTPPAAVSAIFAGLLTKVGVYALMRMFIGVFPPLPSLYTAVLVIAGLTMIVGVLGAVAQHEIRRILSFHIISQIGYIILGIGLMTAADPAVRTLGMAAAIFYTLHHIVVKTNLFFLAGVIERMGGTGRLDGLGGLFRAAPYVGVLFAIPAFSLAGIPPLSGFWAKLGTLQALGQAGQYGLMAAAALAGLLTLISMFKIWNAAFFRPHPAGAVSFGRVPLVMLVPVVCLTGITVAIGLWPEALFSLAHEAAELLVQGPPMVADAVALSGR